VSTGPFRIIATDHTGITVTNLERSVAFWRDVLGFELSHRAHHTGDLASEVTGVPGADISIAVLKAPGHKIELLEYHAPSDRKRAERDFVIRLEGGWQASNTQDRTECRETRCLRSRPRRDNNRVHAATT